MPSTLEFLRAILPNEGYKALVVLKKNRETKDVQRQQRLTPSLDELAQWIFEEDNQSHDREIFELSVYHGCAAFKSPANRTHANALGARSLWLDVDGGPGKPYADAAEAAGAILGMVVDLGLPKPLLVGSGHGCHVYWPLDRLLGVEEWQAHATGLKQACELAGLHADPARTADISSILRPPGTRNRKRGDEPVQCAPLVGPYPVDLFRGLLQGLAPAPVRSQPRGSLPRLASIIVAAVDESWRPSYAGLVADGCAQIGALRAGDEQREPVWRACLGVLAFCEDGEEKAHEWSKAQDKRYTFKETQGKLERSRANSGASLCSQFSGLNRSTCALCSHYGIINSPISLGYKDATPRSARPPVQETRKSVPDHSAGDIVIDGVALPILPGDYHWGSGNQLVFISSSKDKDDDPVTLSEHPLFLDSVHRAEIKGDEVSYVFKQWLPQEGWRDITVPAGVFVGPNGMAELFKHGAVIQERDHFRKYTMAAVDMFNANSKMVTSYEQFGWKDDSRAFLYGRHLYTAGGIKDVTGSNEINISHQYIRANPKGSLAKWADAINQLFPDGFEPHLFVVLSAFAAPLMKFQASNEGGAFVSLVGATSTGKTTALAAATTVWGQKEGLDLGTFDTKISRGVRMGILGNLPVVYDEITRQDKERLQEFLTVFTGGRDKLRATVDGGLRHEARTWQTLLLTGSNKSVVEMAEGMLDDNALGYRVIELEVAELTHTLPANKANELKNSLFDNAGWAADAYLRYLIQPQIVAWLPKAIEAASQQIWQQSGFGDRHRFWVRTIASVLVAAKIVEKLGFLKLSPNAVIDWVIKYLSGELREEPKNTAISVLSEYLNDHFDNMIVVKNKFKPNQQAEVLLHPPRRLLIRAEKDTMRMMISKYPFKEWVQRKGYPFRQVVNDLVVANVLTKGDRFCTLSAGTDKPGGQVACFEVWGQHPAMSGVVVSVEKLVKTEGREPRLRSS